MEQVLLLTLPLVASLSIFLCQVHVNMYCVRVPEIVFCLLIRHLWDFLCYSTAAFCTGAVVTQGPQWLEFSFCYLSTLIRCEQVDTEQKMIQSPLKVFASFTFFELKNKAEDYF